VEEASWAATRGGASVVGWEDRIGGFEIGKEWDAQLIQLDYVAEGGEEGEDAGEGLGEYPG